jgi:energy-coupling factor transport system ATP-binding protein
VSLRLEGVRYRYAGSGRPALDGIDANVDVGTVLAVVGANETGKSTLCLVASGLAPATIGGHLEGSVLIDDLPTNAARPHELAQRCGVLFQNPVTQLSGTAPTVWEEIAFGPRNLGLPLAEIVHRVEGCLRTLAIAGLADRDPQRLSGGQAQLVALAGVLALRPPYLILDEPTSQLDPQGTKLVGDALAGLVAAGRTGILITEHKTDLLARIADRAAVLAAGRIVAEGPADAVLSDGRLDDWGIGPPSQVRLARAAAVAGVSLPETAT